MNKFSLVFYTSVFTVSIIDVSSWRQYNSINLLFTDLNVEAESYPASPDDAVVFKTPSPLVPTEMLAKKILDRPLFNQQRRSFHQSKSDISFLSNLPRLSGIVVSSSTRSAVFAETEGEKSFVVHEGTIINSWKVKQILEKEVIMINETNIQVLRPIRDVLSTPVAALLPNMNTIIPEILPSETAKLVLPSVIPDETYTLSAPNSLSDKPFDTSILEITPPH